MWTDTWNVVLYLAKYMMSSQLNNCYVTGLPRRGSLSVTTFTGGSCQVFTEWCNVAMHFLNWVIYRQFFNIQMAGYFQLHRVHCPSYGKKQENPKETHEEQTPRRKTSESGIEPRLFLLSGARFTTAPPSHSVISYFNAFGYFVQHIDMLKLSTWVRIRWSCYLYFCFKLDIVKATFACHLSWKWAEK